MAYSKEEREEFKEIVRRIKVMNPKMGVGKIREVLLKRKPPLSLSVKFLNSLVKEIAKENAERYRNTTIEIVLGKYQDEIEELKNRLWAIINNKLTTNSEKIAAIRELRNSSSDLFEKMFDAGVFERELGKIKIDNLTDEEKELIEKAIKLDYDGNRANKAEDTDE